MGDKSEEQEAIGSRKLCPPILVDKFGVFDYLLR
jgi:hypothetical protein